MAESDCTDCPLSEQRGRKAITGQFPSTWNGIALLLDQPEPLAAKRNLLITGEEERFLRGVFKSVAVELDQCLILPVIQCAGELSRDAKGKLTEAGKREQWAAIQGCRPYVEAALAHWKPRVTVGFGLAAARFLAGEDAQVDKLRGTVMDLPGAEPAGLGPAMVTEGPKRTLAGFGFSADVVMRDVRRAVRWAVDGWPAWAQEVHLAPSPAELRRLALEWRAAGVLSVDLETIPEPKNRWLCPLRAVGLGGERAAASLPYFAHEVRDYYTPAEWLEVRAILRELLADPQLPKLFHNMQFDIPVLIAHGWEIAGPCHDTMVAHHVLHPRGVLHGLQYAASMYLDVPAWKTEFQKEWEAPFPVLGTYNARDVIVTARLWQAEQEALTARKLRAAYELERWNAEIAWRMSQRGVFVNEARRAELWQVFAAQSAELQARVFEVSGVAEVHLKLLGAADQLAPPAWAAVKLKDYVAGVRPDLGLLVSNCRLVAQLSLTTAHQKGLLESAEKINELAVAGEPDVETGDGRQTAGRICSVTRSAIRNLREAIFCFPFVELTREAQMGVLIHEWLKLPRMAPPNSNGTYATNDHALHHLKDQPIVASWQSWKEASYYRDWLEALPVFADGRIHHAYKTTTTPSCRYAGGSNKEGADPLERWNPQNVNKKVMRVLTAPPGYCLVAGDVKGAELRVAAALSGDPVMKQRILDFDAGKTPHDMHTARAIGLWPDYLTRPKKEQDLLRLIAKRANFLIVYGGGAGTLRGVWKEQLPAEATAAEQEATDQRLFKECQRVIADVRRDWSVLAAWLEEGYQHALKTGQLVIGHLTGTAMRFPLRKDPYVGRSECYNYPIQRTTRELVVAMSQRINPRLPAGCFQVADNHDQLVFEAPLELEGAVRRILEEEMNLYFRGVAIRTDIAVGYDWLDVK